jgi:perosamine synthetase
MERRSSAKKANPSASSKSFKPLKMVNIMQFYHTNISKNASCYISKVLETTRLSEGELVKEFETELQKNLKLPRKPVAVNSGTSGLHLALAVAGVKEGDEVILPAQTFIATGLVVLMQNAKPVFADIQPFTGNICPQSIKKKITPKTKAIMPVHWAGYPCDMDEINKIAKEHGLAVIEDAAHALGATYKERSIGSVSPLTVFSFQAIKHLTTGDGGAVCSLTEADEKQLLKRRWFDIDRETALPSILGERVYDAANIGFKYHMNDFAASLGLGNIGELHDTLQKHRSIAKFYRDNLKIIKGITLLDYKNDRESSYWIFTMLVEDRENFIKALKDRGVPTSVVHQRIDQNGVFGHRTPDLHGQEFFDRKQIALPIHAGLTHSDLETIIQSIQKGW